MYSFLILLFFYYVFNVFFYGLMNNEIWLILYKVFCVGGFGGDLCDIDIFVYYFLRNLFRNVNLL